MYQSYEEYLIKEAGIKDALGRAARSAARKISGGGRRVRRFGSQFADTLTDNLARGAANHFSDKTKKVIKNLRRSGMKRKDITSSHILKGLLGEAAGDFASGRGKSLYNAAGKKVDEALINGIGGLKDKALDLIRPKKSGWQQFTEHVGKHKLGYGLGAAGLGTAGLIATRG